MGGEFPIAKAFPAPPPVIGAALDELRLAAVSPPESEHELRRLAMLPRPWDPATCPPELRGLVYTWLDVAWVDEEHTWRVDWAIPVCWMEHPHIVHELATVACLRWEAAYAVSAAGVEEWHRYTLPMFLELIVQRIGAMGCPPGKHQSSPGGARNALYRDPDEAGARRRRRHREEPHFSGRLVRQ